MMVLFRKTILTIIIFLFFAGISVSGKKQENFNPGNTVGVETIVTAVTMADLIISENKVSKTVTWNMKLFSPTELEQRKENLIKELCQEVGADILIDPQFTFSKRILGGGKLTVTGYPAAYKNFRNLTEQEIERFVVNRDSLPGKIIFINQ